MICAIQEQAITTRYIQRKIHHTTDNDWCRLCRQAAETIHHITSGCVVMAPTKYLQRHDNVCNYVHDLLLNEFDFKENQTAWYQHQPRTVEENANAKILWNFAVHTDHALQHNKPDIIVINKTNNKALIIDVAVPNDNNVFVNVSTRSERTAIWQLKSKRCRGWPKLILFRWLLV